MDTLSYRADCLSGPLAKLERRRPFASGAREAFLTMRCRRSGYKTQQDIVREGEGTKYCQFLESGMISRSKLLSNGGRQIASFHMAGDLVDLSSALMLVADHTLRTHAPTVIVQIEQSTILTLAQDYPEIGRAFWFETLVDGSIFREWSLNLGRRNARERTAHLLMEMGYRSEDAQLGARDDFALPVTQADLADALGLTVVHVNRSLKWLREQGMIKLAKGRMMITDWEALAYFSQFEPLYLHPEGPRGLGPQ